MIKGKKIALRALEKNDLKRCWKWMNDPEVFVGEPGIRLPESFYEEEKWYEETQKDVRTKIFAIQIGKRHIGNIGLHNIDNRNKRAELGIMIGDKNCWDKGYGSDAIKTILSMGFNELNLHKIYLHVFPSNKRAFKCYEKCGFKKEGALMEHVFKGGKYQDLIVMSIVRRKK